MRKIRLHGAPAAKLQTVEISQSANHRDLALDAYEDELRARLQEITAFVESLTGSTVTLLLAENPLDQDVLQEVVIKEAALRWIARVAGVSTGSVRQRLWKDIEKALDDLEVIVILLGHVHVAWPADQTLDFRNELVHIT
jgi:hypothetical protein